MLRYRFAVCHTTCNSCTLRSGSYYVLQSHFVHYFFRSLHSVSFTGYAIAFAAGCFNPTTKSISQNKPAVSQARWFIPPHYAQLRHSFISVGCSPPAAAVVVLALRPASAAGCHGFSCPRYSPCLEQKHTPTLASHCCCL